MLSRAALALVLLAAGTAVAAEKYVPGLDDVPLMPGLEPVRAEGIDFDTPAGRIVEAYATGPVTSDAVIAYYGHSLPQLGWTRIAALAFLREGETLTLEIMGQGRPLTVQFRLAPAERTDKH